MACNTSRSQCTPGNTFTTAIPGCAQFFNPANFQAEQLIYDAAYQDLINSFGIPIDYYINTFNLSAADLLYGEQPLAVFYGPISIQMYAELSENAINLSKFGFASDDELTGFIHITTFASLISGKDYFIQTSKGDILQYDEYLANINDPNIGTSYSVLTNYLATAQDIEPKSGDLIQMSPLGCDRPNGRGAKIFEVTERTDQDVASLNPLLGHYVWRLKAKRFEYSFEPGAPREPKNQQTQDSAFSGLLSSQMPLLSSQPDHKVFPHDIEADSKSIFDMSANDTDIYGTYY